MKRVQEWFFILTLFATASMSSEELFIKTTIDLHGAILKDSIPNVTSMITCGSFCVNKKLASDCHGFSINQNDCDLLYIWKLITTKPFTGKEIVAFVRKGYQNGEFL